jgi:two-component system, NarL family, response regulator LiaR
MKEQETMAERITVLITDDHSIVRHGVRAFLEAQPDIHVVGEAESGAEAVRLAQEYIPDVVLMDLIMPGMDGVEATRQIKRVSPRTQVVVLTSYHEDEHIFPALRAGAISYTLKTIRATELAELVRKAAQGESILHPSVAVRVIQEVREARRSVPRLR